MRIILPELLDDTPAPQALASLQDLTRINRFLGGYVTLRSLLRTLVKPTDRFSLLDIGAASGDMGAQIRRHFPNAHVFSFDRRLNHLATAWPPRVAGNAFQLPFAPAAFDFVFSSLFLHHFDDETVVHLLTDFGQLARRAVLAIDLERGPLAYRFIPATRWLFRWDPITLHDAPISVQAAFKASELKSLAERAGLQHPTVRVYRPWSRLALIAPVGESR